MTLADHRAGAKLLGEGRTAEVFERDGATVIKLFRREFPRHLGEREAETTEIAAACATFAPKFHGTVELDDRFGIVLERVSGPTLTAAASSRPWLLVNYAHMLARLHAEMHTRRAQRLPSQHDSLVATIELAPGLGTVPRQLALDALAALPEQDNLCHGDFHPDNVILAARGPVVIDWMSAVRGNPVTDAARTSFLLSAGALLPQTPPLQRVMAGLGRGVFHALYLRHYLRVTGASRSDVRSWRLVVLAARLAEGIATERQSLLAMIDEEVARGEKGQTARR
jgi:hypothetical protein